MEHYSGDEKIVTQAQLSFLHEIVNKPPQCAIKNLNALATIGAA
jgi:hypothetical protein